MALIVQSSNDKQSKAAEMQDNVNAMKGKATEEISTALYRSVSHYCVTELHGIEVQSKGIA